MQAKCPKCVAPPFRMLPDSPHLTEVECLTCGHVAPSRLDRGARRPARSNPSNTGPRAGEDRTS